MTREEAKRILYVYRAVNLVDASHREAFDMAITELEQEPCDDVISRQEAIDAFERFIHELGIKDEPYNYGEMALSVQNVPPVTPAEKVGHWIYIGNSKVNGLKICKCSNCKKKTYGSQKFCPNCGIKMEV